ncbi:MAG: HTH domain-containing protein [Lachnospiraceae bacterium]|nr:HTH domain-containing protein [Lachnospiraceae bacterium]
MKIKRILAAGPKTTYSDLEEEFQISRSTVKRVIKSLVDKGAVERKGGKRYGYWEVKDY